jgi:hypothetical protein
MNNTFAKKTLFYYRVLMPADEKIMADDVQLMKESWN